MATFNFIMDKIINFKNNIFSQTYINDDIDNIYKIFFYILYNNYGNKYKSKFDFLEQTLNNFYFYNKLDKKNQLLHLFYKIQRVYHILNRFCYLYKYKKSKLVVETDLQLNTIKMGEPNIICIYHINNKYLFKIQDLLKLIYTSLTNSYIHFAEPVSIKNPYNNIPFGKSVLYYIDYILGKTIHIRFIKYNHFDIFSKFKECNFNMTLFVNNYEYILREYSIQNYINNSTKQVLKNEILQIIKQFNRTLKDENKKIYISEDFSDDILIKVFKPYLRLKIISDVSLITKNKTDARINLHKKLIEFQKFNPYFSKKIIKLKNTIKNKKFRKIKSNIEFNTKFKKFNDFNIENFMKNHLVYKYNSDDSDDSDEYNNDGYDDDNNNNNNNNETIFNLNIITEIIHYPPFNYNYEISDINNEEDTEEDTEENEHLDNIEEQEGDEELTTEEYDDNESIS